MRTFETGATRDSDEGKIDYLGFLSPFALRAFGEYMLQHQVQADGTRRPSDNWKQGIPIDAYMRSAFRHWHEAWESYERTGVVDRSALCALFFNVQGVLHEQTKSANAAFRPTKGPIAVDRDGKPLCEGDIVDWLATDNKTVYDEQVVAVNKKGEACIGDLPFGTNLVKLVPEQVRLNRRRA
jgi:hypothetical protein